MRYGELTYPDKVREHSSAVELCGPHIAISPAMTRFSNGELTYPDKSLNPMTSVAGTVDATVVHCYYKTLLKN